MSNGCFESIDNFVCTDEVVDLRYNKVEVNPPLLTNYFICPSCKSPMDKINIRFCHICGWEEYLL